MRISDMQERLGRFEARAERKRALLTQVMERAQLKKLQEPDFTVSLRAVPPGLVVCNEADIPQEFWKPQAPKLDRKGLLAALSGRPGHPRRQSRQWRHHHLREDKIMAFSQTQIRKLAGKLPERFVKTRNQRGITLSYIEGWHVIDEANRVFGFDGWDRETIWSECVWQDGRQDPKACTYGVRVRIRVRAGKTLISREGSGVGHGTGATLGDAHESALKEAETDATKRALTTFGNLFGLALYDKDQAGVQRSKPAESSPRKVLWTLLSPSGQPTSTHDEPRGYCSALRQALQRAASLAELEALWRPNLPVIAQLRAVVPPLTTRTGTHYADLLERLYRQQTAKLQPAPMETRYRSSRYPSCRDLSNRCQLSGPRLSQRRPRAQPSTHPLPSTPRPSFPIPNACAIHHICSSSRHSLASSAAETQPRASSDVHAAARHGQEGE